VLGIPEWVRHIVVVVDASPDDTYERLVALRARGLERLVVLRHEINRGVGGAMQTGFKEALRLGASIVVKMDGDDQMDPAQLPALVAPLIAGQADVTKGNRYASAASVRAMPVVRIMGNAGLTFLVKAASGYWNIFDPANGYVALRREALEALQIERLPERYFFESGLLIELGIRRAVVADVNMPARYGDERSSLSIGRTLLGFPPRLVWGLTRRVFWRYFVHDFSPVSLFLVSGLALTLGGTIYGAVRWWQLNVRADAFAPTGEIVAVAMSILLPRCSTSPACHARRSPRRSPPNASRGARHSKSSAPRRARRVGATAETRRRGDRTAAEGPPEGAAPRGCARQEEGHRNRELSD
jgi:hypothetical protein